MKTYSKLGPLSMKAKKHDSVLMNFVKYLFCLNTLPLANTNSFGLKLVSSIYCFTAEFVLGCVLVSKTH